MSSNYFIKIGTKDDPRKPLARFTKAQMSMGLIEMMVIPVGQEGTALHMM